MEILSQYYLPGAVPMWSAVLFALASLWGYTLAAGGDKSALAFARRSYGFFSLSVILAAVVLAISLYRRDFRIEYVYQYSGMELADHFQIAAFWAGQKGSFLIWLLWGVLLGIPLSRTAGRDEPTVMWVYMTTVLGLVLILARNNPFLMLPETPADGAGLNPLLQDDWMVIHPPVMFIGYAAAAIPFAFALAAVWRGDTKNWATRAFPWTLGGFLVLGTGILMGGYWAYRTLGWGGYWGWDPVENASLIPWLIGVILIHGMYLEKTRKRYRRINLVLACLLYLSVLYGTFLTRSGVLADFSVHSFVDLGLSAWLIGLMSFHGGMAFLLLAYRWKSVETSVNEDPLISRGMMLVLSTLTVGVSAVLITLGTSSPIITGWYSEYPAQAGPEFYNTVHMPLALLAAALLAVVPFATWRGVTGQKLIRQLIPSMVAALAVTIFGAVIGVEEPIHHLFVFLSSWALTANLQKVLQLARRGGWSSTGGYLSHVGVGIMLLGILASSAYDFSTKVTLPQGEPVQVGDLNLTFERYIPRQGREKERMEVTVVREDGSSYKSYPKLFVNDRTRQLMANPHIQKTLLQDLYISPIQYEPAESVKVDGRIELSRGQRARVGEVQVHFADIEMPGGPPMAQLSSTGVAEILLRFEVERGQGAEIVRVPFRFTQQGPLRMERTPMPGGGSIAITSFQGTGAARLEVATTDTGPVPARLSIDVTKKPLIKMVWYGLYVVLAGGLVSTFKRFRNAQKVDTLDARLGRGGTRAPSGGRGGRKPSPSPAFPGSAVPSPGATAASARIGGAIGQASSRSSLPRS
ncbi:MAG: cytochrome c biogenesis protein CcsA [Acidobacteriota bacterium]